MQTKIENGIKWISCDNLGEVVEKFKEFREGQIAADQKRGWDNYAFLLSCYEINDDRIVTGKIKSVKIYQQDGIDLCLNLDPFNLDEKSWKPYNQKVKKILKEIWETGEVKNYQGLNPHWPIIGGLFCDQCKKTIENYNSTYFSNREKNLDFCSEGCYYKFKEINVLEEGNNNKNILIAISIVIIITLVLALLFYWLKRPKKR